MSQARTPEKGPAEVIVRGLLRRSAHAPGRPGPVRADQAPAGSVGAIKARATSARGPLTAGEETAHGAVMRRMAGVPASLVSVQTRDGVILDGVAAHPRGRRRTAFIWVHGSGSTFSSGQPLIRVLSARLKAALRHWYLKLNTRVTAWSRAPAKRLAGAAFEHFGESVHDIRGVISPGGPERLPPGDSGRTLDRRQQSAPLHGPDP